MTKPKILNSTPMHLPELKKELKSIEKRDEELSFRAQKVDEYLQTISLLSQTKAKKLSKDLHDLEVPRLKDSHIAKLIDLRPTSPDEVKALLRGYGITISKENLKSIAEAIEEYI